MLWHWSYKRIRAVPLALGLVVLSFFLLNALFSRLEMKLLDLRDHDGYVWQHKLHLLSDGSLSQAEVLILGDSQVMGGIFPSAMEGNSRSVYNLGLPSQQPEGMVLLARMAVEKMPKLKRVIINVSPFSVFKSDISVSFRKFYKNEALHFYPVTLLRNPAQAGGVGDWFYQLLRISPVFRFRDITFHFTSIGEVHKTDVPELMREKEEVENYLLNGPNLSVAQNRRREKNGFIREELNRNQGFWIWNRFVPLDASPERVCQVSGEKMANTGWKLLYPDRSGAIAAWRELLSVFSNRNIPVVLVRIPFEDSWHSIADSKDVNRRFTEKIEKILAGSDNTIFLDRPDSWPSDDSSLYRDWVHLSFCGAQKYSSWLRGQLN